MAITVELSQDLPHTIVADMDDDWTWEEMTAALEQISEMAEEIPQTCLLITTVPNTMARRSAVLKNLGQRVTQLPKNIDLTVIVGASHFTKVMMDVLNRVGLARNIVFANSLEDAHTMIRQRSAK